jgi:MFS transporter, DHA2 family, methylenomycin A resistance protein
MTNGETPVGTAVRPQQPGAGNGQHGGRSPAPLRYPLAAAMLGFFMISLDATALTVALPSIGRSLHSPTAGLQWVVDGYTVPFAALLISAGAVSDRLGARRVFGWGVGVFAVASVACGLAPAVWLLVGGRVVAGCAAAAMLPASLALVRQAYDNPAARARAIAVWSAGGAAAMAAGPVFGGILTSAVSWRAIFFLNVPAGLAAAVLLARVPASPRLVASLDPAGQVTAVTGLAALVFGVISAGTSGYASAEVLAAFAVALLALVSFAVAESRAAQPMVPLPLLRSPAVAAVLLAGFSINAAFYGVAFVLSLYFQRVLGETPVIAGLLFLPMTGLLTVANLAAARVAARRGHQLPVRLGLIVGTVGMVALAFSHGLPAMEIALVPAGAGLGFALPSLTFQLLDALPPAQAGLAGGLFNAGRQTGGALAVAVFGVLVSGSAGSFATGMRACMLAGAVLLAASTAALLAVAGRRRQRSAQPAATG